MITSKKCFPFCGNSQTTKTASHYQTKSQHNLLFMREFALPNYPQAVTYHSDVQKNNYNSSLVCFGHIIRVGGFLRNKITSKK